VWKKIKEIGQLFQVVHHRHSTMQGVESEEKGKGRKGITNNKITLQ